MDPVQSVARALSSSPCAHYPHAGRLLLNDSDSPQEEPSAGKPHARICGGEAEWPSYPTVPRSRLLVVSEVLTMRFHPAGLVVLVAFLLLALVGGAGPAVAVVRVAVAIFGVAATVEVVVNMVRHRNLRVQSRLLGLLGEQGSFAARMGSRKP
jgi:hypothetical protein